MAHKEQIEHVPQGRSSQKGEVAYTSKPAFTRHVRTSLQKSPAPAIYTEAPHLRAQNYIGPGVKGNIFFSGKTREEFHKFIEGKRIEATRSLSRKPGMYKRAINFLNALEKDVIDLQDQLGFDTVRGINVFYVGKKGMSKPDLGFHQDNEEEDQVTIVVSFGPSTEYRSLKGGTTIKLPDSSMVAHNGVSLHRTPKSNAPNGRVAIVLLKGV